MTTEVSQRISMECQSLMRRVSCLLVGIALVACEPMRPVLAVESVTTSGDRVEVKLAAVEGFFQRDCSGQSWLGKSDGGTFVDEVPLCPEPFFLDGTYFDNPGGLECRCDTVGCRELPASNRF
jgi:hypothetical protein